MDRQAGRQTGGRAVGMEIQTRQIDGKTNIKVQFAAVNTQTLN